MTPAEDLIRSTTAAIAATVRDAPALRLSPADGELASFAPRSRGARRLRGWLAPVAAAAVVLAVALSLVIIRDLPNGRVVPPATPASSSTGDAPGYYLMIANNGDSGSGNGLQIRDTFTGKPVAFVAPPKASMFAAVTGAGAATFRTSPRTGNGRVRRPHRHHRPTRQREALVLRYYLDMTEDQAAEAMRVSRGTVKSATSRAVAAVGRMLGAPVSAHRSGEGS